MQNFVQVMFRPILRTDKTYVVCKYTNFIISSGLFQALFVSDRLYIKSQNPSCFGWIKSSLYPTFSTIKLLFYRKYTNFMTFREQINEFGHILQMVASVFIEHRSPGRWAWKYQWFYLAHISTLLTYLSNFIKRFIELAHVIIGVQFLQI